jgi:transcriptional regulator of arginine metabolism
MDHKTQRLLAIKKIISGEKISNQEELLSRLSSSGFDLTQATISRDLRALQIGKRPDQEKGSIFFLPDQENSSHNFDHIDTRLLEAGIKAIHFANQFGIIKTIPGYANSIAIHIDNAGRYEIIGTIAGDDTILLIPDQDISHAEMKKALQLIFPTLDEYSYKS